MGRHPPRYTLLGVQNYNRSNFHNEITCLWQVSASLHLLSKQTPLSTLDTLFRNNILWYFLFLQMGTRAGYITVDWEKVDQDMRHAGDHINQKIEEHQQDPETQDLIQKVIVISIACFLDMSSINSFFFLLSSLFL